MRPSQISNGIDGHKYGTWSVNRSSTAVLQASVLKQWFGSRLVSPQDRLGSRGKYYAFGEERTNITPANPPNDQEKFATYTRDSATGLDYANQRYYSSTIARFTRPDPFGGSANSANPQSWNRYSYVSNDPANRFDPSGLDDGGSFDYGDEYFEDPPGGGGTLDPGDGAIDGPIPVACPGCTVNVTDSVDPISPMPGTIGFNYNPGGSSSNSNAGSPAPVPVTPAPKNQILPCLVKGVVIGSAGAIAVGALAVGAAAVGAPVAAVTAALGIVAVAGGAALGYDTIGQIRSGNWAGVAYNAGSVLGGALVGGAGGRAIAEGINGVASPAWSWASDLAQGYKSNLGSIGSWLGTGPNPGSAGGSAAAAGAGTASTVKKGC